VAQQLSGPPRRGLLRVLSLVADVRPGEVLVALLLALDVFLLLSAYYVVKPVREALILAGSGALVKSYAAAGQAMLLLLLVPAYAALAARTSRQRLVPGVTVGFAVCLVGFYLAARTGVPGLGVVFFLWVGVFNLVVIAQFWGFVADLYGKARGERLLPLVALGASLGALGGSRLTAVLVGALGVEPLLLLSAALLVASAAVTVWVERLLRAGDADPEAPGSSPQPLEQLSARRGSYRLVLQSPYLLLLGASMLLLNLVNTTGEYVLGSVVEATARRLVARGASGGLDVGEYIGAFYADFYFWTNLLGVALQFGLVARLLRWLGVRGALLVLPSLALCAYGLLALAPGLGAIRIVKTLENATDYSLNNTVRNALFLPLSREEKYQAKQVIDGFCVRAGDALSAGFVFVGGALLGLGAFAFAALNVGLVALWLVVAARAGALYARGQTGARTGVRPAEGLAAP
jgi:AAA family ATP:ADP antiporter